MRAEQEHEERRHQRAAADAGQPDEHPDEQPGQRVKRIIAGEYVSLCSSRLGRGLVPKTLKIRKRDGLFSPHLAFAAAPT
jgi:hypothetical protein